MDKVWILSREVSCESLLRVKTLILDLNVGPTKKLASGDLTVIKRCKSDYHLISPHNISPESLIK